MINLANLVSLSRIPLLFIIAILSQVHFLGAATLAFTLYLIGGFTDFFDGYIARKFNMVSNFGKFVDALTDKIFVLGLFVCLISMNALPKWALFLVLLILAREFLVTGLRLVAASRGMVLAAEKSGKIKTIMQMLTIGTVLCQEAVARDFYRFLGMFIPFLYWLGLIFFVVATYLTVQSGINYLTKYWYILTEEN